MASDRSGESKPSRVSWKSGIPVYQGVLSDDSIPDLIDRVREDRIREICVAACGEEFVERNSGALPTNERSGNASEEQIPQG